MVTSATLSSSKSAQLSYADRAKHVKAPPSQNTSLRYNSVTTTAGPSTATDLPGPSKPSANAGNSQALPLENAKAESSTSTAQVRCQSRSSSSPPPPMSAHSLPNGNVSTTNSSTVTTTAPPPTSAKPPPVNVWNLRKEQMAQSNANSRAPLALNAQNHPSSNTDADTKITPGAALKEAPARLAHPAKDAQNSSENDDPFTVRLRATALLPIDDRDSWPEVGSSAQSTASHNSKESKEGSEKMERDKSRKGEKPKWVPIPPSELLAAADEARSQTHLHSQSYSRQYDHTRNRTASTAGSSSGSAIVSHRSSRAQSLHTSTSQSRVHSRTGSTQASPRQFAKPKLPAEGGASDVVPPHLLNGRSSRANSPTRYTNSHARPGDAPGPSYGADQGLVYGAPSIFPGQLMRHHSFEHEESPPQYPYYFVANGYGNGSNKQGSTSPQNHDYPYGNYLYKDQYQCKNGSPAAPVESHQQVHLSSSDVDESFIPSPATLARPSPPTESEALGRYPDMRAIPLFSEGARREDRGRMGRDMIFGSIGPLGSTEESRPTTPDAKLAPRSVSKDVGKAVQRGFSAFSIGIRPDDVPRKQSMTSSKARKQGDATLSMAIEPTGGEIEPLKPVIDLTGPRWEFGTVTSLDLKNTETSSELPNIGTNELMSHKPPPPTTKDATLPNEHQSEGDDEWEVRDFGYGFGSMSGSGRAPALVREEMIAREKQRVQEQELERQQELERERETTPEGDIKEKDREVGRSRGTSLSGERGTFVPRRGRGAGPGFGRGYGPRNYSRGYQGHARHQPPFAITPPNHFQQLPHGYSPDTTPGYYLPPPNYAPYGVGYDVYAYAPYASAPAAAPPVPAPLSTLSFPLDPTRYYLLGQLEYYLSPQNMAQDFFLRKQMDAQGWISIPLLASFNRVRQLTMDIQLVREVMTLSSMLEVNEDWVRMARQMWKQFLLPTTDASENEQIFGQTEEDVPAEDDDDEDVEFVMG